MSQSWSILMFSLDSYGIPLSQVVLSFPNLYFVLILNAHFFLWYKGIFFYLIDVIENSSCLIVKLKVLDLVLIY